MSLSMHAHDFRNFWSHVSSSRQRQVCSITFRDIKKMKYMLLMSLFYLALPMPGQASAIPMSKSDSVCDAAAQHAAAKTGVPLNVLLAITRAETGLLKGDIIQPWPWTVNMQGRGVWFETKSEALAFVFEHFKTGSRSFDVGCFQINYRWHGASFASIEDMFDPSSNALYAALFLKSLHSKSGDWTVAAGAFHSRTPVRADRYMVRFVSMLAELDQSERGEISANSSSTVDDQRNSFLLIPKGQAAGLASLVPFTAAEEIKPLIEFTIKGRN